MTEAVLISLTDRRPLMAQTHHDLAAQLCLTTPIVHRVTVWWKRLEPRDVSLVEEGRRAQGIRKALRLGEQAHPHLTHGLGMKISPSFLAPFPVVFQILIALMVYDKGHLIKKPRMMVRGSLKKNEEFVPSPSGGRHCRFLEEQDLQFNLLPTPIF